MKRRIIAALMALCLCIGLLPATALAATAGDDDSPVTLEYENDGIANDYSVNVFVYTDQGENPVKTLSVNDARMADNDMKITVVDSQYEIDHIDFDGVSTAETEWIAPDLRSYSFTCSFVAITADTLNVSVYLRTVQKKPTVEGDVYSERWLDVGLRVYDSQLLKMLHLEDQEVSPATEIASIKWNFYHGINDAVVDENSINRENDYWECVALDNYHGWAIPYNVQSLEITYRDNAGANEQTVTIPAGDLCFVRGTIAGQPGYEIQSGNEDLHIVYFYNETDGNAGNHYFPYAIRFVEDGEALGDQMPPDPTYQDSLYQFVNWEQNDWDGDGTPFLSTTIVNDDLTVFARKMSSASGGTEIHISNEDNRLFDRVAELFNEESQSDPELSAGDIQKDSVQIVVRDSGNNATDKGGDGDRWMLVNDDWYLVYSTYGLDHIDFTHIESIDVYFKVAGSDEEHKVSIPVGEYPGDISVRMSDTENVVDLLVNGPEVLPRPEDPDPEPGDDYAITGIDKALVDSDEEKATATAAGIDVVDYNYPDAESGKVIIPDEDGATVTLLYAITVTGKAGATFTVTDEDADLVAGSVTEDTANDTFSGTIPEEGTITFYVSKTFTAADINGDGNLTNTATVAGKNEDDADPDEDEDTEETPAEEDVTTIPLDVYVYLRVEGSGQNGELTDEDLATIAEWKLEKSNPDDYYILGKLSGVGLPEDILTDGELTYEKYATYIKQAFTDSKFMAYKENSVIDEDFLNGIAWENLVWASGAPGYESETQEGNCLHLDGVLKLKSSYDLTYDANGGTINGNPTFDVNNITPANPTNYKLGEETDYTAPTHADEGTEDVLFAGWTLTNTEGKIYSVEDAKNGSVPAAVDAVDLTKNDTVYALWSYDEDNDGTPDINEIIVTPADITIYTGGMGYGGVTDAEGNVIDEYEGSGLPKPGYHITLPAGLADELGLKDGIDLAKALSFSYSGTDELTGEAVTRAWDMTCAGVYSNTPLRYVYSLNADKVTDTEVRLLFKDAEGNVKDNDQIDMSAEAPSAKYTMTINPGGLDQKAIKAVFTVNGGQPVERSVFIDTGTLTIRSITDPDQEVTTPIIASDDQVTGDTITAQAGNGVTYHVNDSEVRVDAGRVELLVDEVSGSEEFNQALGDDAISEVEADAVLNVSLTTPAYDLAYLDLVDAQNGNAVVTVDSGELTIHWPVPADAADDSKFYVVHYHDGMDRETPVDQNAVANINNTVKAATQDGDYITFTTSTFSPFALVYEKDGTTPPVTQYTVTYDANGGRGTMASQTVNAGDSVTIRSNAFTRSNYAFDGWNTRADGRGTSYGPGDSLTVNGNITLYAQWDYTGGGDYNPKDATLRFNSRGGTEFDDIVRDDPFEYNPYNKIPTRPGYRFTGWYDSSRLDDRYDEDEEISVPMGITTVWAGWEETSVPSMLNGDDHYAYIQGYSDGTVRPNANITRAQVATIFFRLLDEDVRDDNLTTYNTFPDVDEDYWANTAISTMASLGVINGRNSGLFDPDAYITRAEFAAICARFDDSGVDGITTFTDTVGHWAEDEISRAAALGWIQGYSDGTFRPNQYITRAQAVTMINRVLCRLPEDTDDLLSGMNTWTDCHEDDWFYLAIQEATNSHDFVAKDRVYESWTDLNRAPDWSRYE